MIPTPPTPAELELMKKFWSEEDEKNGGVSDVSRCIAEIERLQKIEIAATHLLNQLAFDGVLGVDPALSADLRLALCPYTA